VHHTTEVEPVQHTTENIEQPRRWDERMARWISNLLSPPMVAIAGLVLALRMLEKPKDAWWLLYFMGLTVALPVGYIIWKVRRGEITDFHVRVREQRIRPLSLAVAGGMASLTGLWLGHAPIGLMALASMGVMQVAFLLLVTLKWKISGHGAAVSSLAVFLCGLYGTAAAPALLTIPLVAWARLRLRRHTLWQTICGSLAGAAFTLGLLAAVPIG